jgi:hypothetical protein
VSFSPKRHKKAKNIEKEKLKIALHLVHSNSFSPQKSLHFCKLDHRWCATLILIKTG